MKKIAALVLVIFCICLASGIDCDAATKSMKMVPITGKAAGGAINQPYVWLGDDGLAYLGNGRWGYRSVVEAENIHFKPKSPVEIRLNGGLVGKVPVQAPAGFKNSFGYMENAGNAHFSEPVILPEPGTYDFQVKIFTPSGRDYFLFPDPDDVEGFRMVVPRYYFGDWAYACTSGSDVTITFWAAAIGKNPAIPGTALINIGGSEFPATVNRGYGNEFEAVVKITATEYQALVGNGVYTTFTTDPGEVFEAWVDYQVLGDLSSCN